MAMTRIEVNAVREMTVVNVMDLLRRGRIDKSTTNQKVMNILRQEYSTFQWKLVRGNLEILMKMKCVKCICKDDRGRLKADVKKDASGLMYEATEGDIIVTQMEGDEMSEYGIVLPSEDNIND